jgi:hypothetical protein
MQLEFENPLLLSTLMEEEEEEDIPSFFQTEAQFRKLGNS